MTTTKPYAPDDAEMRARATEECTHLTDEEQARYPREWDAWLRAHDARVRAEALRDAAFEFAEGAWSDQWVADGVHDDVTAVRSTERWLVARAAGYDDEADDWLPTDLEDGRLQVPGSSDS